ncbi:MAG: hypothetical protein Kow00121_19910 [Elainellaceae cyanobacterium]
MKPPNNPFPVDPYNRDGRNPDCLILRARSQPPLKSSEAEDGTEIRDVSGVPEDEHEPLPKPAKQTNDISGNPSDIDKGDKAPGDHHTELMDEGTEPENTNHNDAEPSGNSPISSVIEESNEELNENTGATNENHGSAQTTAKPNAFNDISNVAENENKPSGTTDEDQAHSSLQQGFIKSRRSFSLSRSNLAKLLLAFLVLVPLLFWLSRFFWPKPEPSSTIYVDPNNGDDRNNGTRTQPLKTLDLALNQARSRNDLDHIALPEDAELFNKSLSCTAFSDIDNNWASEFIKGLAAQGIVRGYPDCTFQPDAKLTRAEYAALLAQTFNLPEIQTVQDFVDVPPDFWAHNAIQRNYSNKFLVGLGDSNDFKPNDNLKRVEVIAPLVSGLNLSSEEDDTNLSFYEDSASIPAWARGQVATATSNQLIVNYPNPTVLNPTQDATRAETVAMLYQALVETNRTPTINSAYIVTVPKP